MNSLLRFLTRLIARAHGWLATLEAMVARAMHKRMLAEAKRDENNRTDR